MRAIILVFVLIFAGCSTSQNIKPSTSESEQISVEKTESNSIPFSKRVYFFQHKMISKWVFESDGAFYNDLKENNIRSFILNGAQVVGQNYMNEVLVEPIDGKDAVLITFPEPESAANCFYAIVQKTDDDFSYFTYEKTFHFPGISDGIEGVVGGWGRDGGHLNFGPRAYKTSAEFVVDVLK